MKLYCINCGLRIEPGTRFCSRCGVMIIEETPIPPPLPVMQQPLLQQVPPPRFCTKCSLPLEPDVLFCSSCGTKNYVFQRNKVRKGELLVVLRGCSLVKLQLIKTPGILFIHDDRIYFQSDQPGNNLLIPYTELTGVSAHNTLSEKLCIKLIGTSGKTTVLSLSDSDADFYYYVINLISDFKS